MTGELVIAFPFPWPCRFSRHCLPTALMWLSTLATTRWVGGRAGNVWFTSVEPTTGEMELPDIASMRLAYITRDPIVGYHPIVDDTPRWENIRWGANVMYGAVVQRFALLCLWPICIIVSFAATLGLLWGAGRRRVGPVCPACAYDVRANLVGNCPECGVEL